MIRLAQTARGDFAVRVVVGRVLSVESVSQPIVDGERELAGLSCTRLVLEHGTRVRELSVVHLEPIDVLPHRNITIVTGCEVHIEWLLYVYNANDKNHRRFDEHIRWFLNSQSGEPLSEADQRLIWSAILLQVLPSGTR